MFNTMLEDVRAVRRNDPASHGWVRRCSAMSRCTRSSATAWRIGCTHAWACAGRARALGPDSLLDGRGDSPGASHCKGFFLDHGAGVVIGETATIGDYCVMFHNVHARRDGKVSRPAASERGRSRVHWNQRHLLGPFGWRSHEDRGQRVSSSTAMSRRWHRRGHPGPHRQARERAGG